MKDQELEELKAEFEKGYQLFEQSKGKLRDIQIEDKLKEQKVGSKKIPINFVLMGSELIGTYSEKYRDKIKELEEKVNGFCKKEGLRLDAPPSFIGFYLASESGRVAYVGINGFAAKKSDMFVKLAELYGY